MVEEVAEDSESAKGQENMSDDEQIKTGLTELKDPRNIRDNEDGQDGMNDEIEDIDSDDEIALAYQLE